MSQGRVAKITYWTQIRPPFRTCLCGFRAKHWASSFTALPDCTSFHDIVSHMEGTSRTCVIFITPSNLIVSTKMPKGRLVAWLSFELQSHCPNANISQVHAPIQSFGFIVSHYLPIRISDRGEWSSRRHTVH